MPRLAHATLLLAALTTAPGIAQSSERSAAPRHLVQVAVTRAALPRLLALDLDLASCCDATSEVQRARLLDVIATPTDVQRIEDAGFRARVLIRDLPAHYREQLDLAAPPAANDLPTSTLLTPPLGQGAMGGHYTLAQMESILDAFHTAHPTLCSQKVSIGTSIEGRALWMVKISDNVDLEEGEPEALFTGLHHAREPLSMESLILFMDELLNGYGTDTEATQIVNERALYFVPCVNPDGYEHNRSTDPGGGGLWRKNRRPNADGSLGVDLNRNYTIGWSAPNGGNSATPSSGTYRGTAALTEPETIALDAFVASRSFVHVMNCHAYGELLLRPFGYQGGTPARLAEYDLLGDVMSADNGALYADVFTGLYPIAGGGADHYDAVHSAYSWLAELGTIAEGGFWPTPAQTVDIARRHQPMFRAAAMTAGARLTIDSLVVNEIPGASDGDGIVEAGESGSLRVQWTNAGASASAASGLALSSGTAGVSINSGTTAFGATAAFASGDSGMTALTFSLPAGFSPQQVELTVALSGDGRSTAASISFWPAALRTVIFDNMERDRGFARDPAGTATTGLWERAAPQATSNSGQPIQLGTQNSPGGQLCWVTDARAGASAGTYDVDNGATELLSPIIDLAHADVIELSFARFYSENAANDAFEAFVSDDGGQSWSRILQDSASTGGWTTFRSALIANPSDRMRFKFRAQDFNPSLVEAGIDDVRIRAGVAEAALSLLTSAVPGSSLRFGVAGTPGHSAYVLVSPRRAANPIAIPGFSGSLALDPLGLLALPGVSIDADGHAGSDLGIPANPALVGSSFHFQAVVASPAPALTLGNAMSLTLR